MYSFKIILEFHSSAPLSASQERKKRAGISNALDAVCERGPLGVAHQLLETLTAEERIATLTALQAQVEQELSKYMAEEAWSNCRDSVRVCLARSCHKALGNQRASNKLFHVAIPRSAWIVTTGKRLPKKMGRQNKINNPEVIVKLKTYLIFIFSSLMSNHAM